MTQRSGGEEADARIPGPPDRRQHRGALRRCAIDSNSPSDIRGDEALLAAARQGDSGALETLISRYQPRVYRFGLKMCHDIEDAADVVQDTLLAMVRSIRDFRGDSSLSSWLYTIARRFCIRKRRRGRFAARDESLKSLGAERLPDLSDRAPDPEQHTAGREIETVLSAAIDSLDVGSPRPARHRRPLRA